MSFKEYIDRLTNSQNPSEHDIDREALQSEIMRQDESLMPDQFVAGAYGAAQSVPVFGDLVPSLLEQTDPRWHGRLEQAAEENPGTFQGAQLGGSAMFNRNKMLPLISSIIMTDPKTKEKKAIGASKQIDPSQVHFNTDIGNGYYYKGEKEPFGSRGVIDGGVFNKENQKVQRLDIAPDNEGLMSIRGHYNTNGYKGGEGLGSKVKQAVANLFGGLASDDRGTTSLSAQKSWAKTPGAKSSDVDNKNETKSKYYLPESSKQGEFDNYSDAQVTDKPRPSVAHILKAAKNEEIVNERDFVRRELARNQKNLEDLKLYSDVSSDPYDIKSLPIRIRSIQENIRNLTNQLNEYK